MRAVLLTIIFTFFTVVVMVSPFWKSGVFDKSGNLLFDGGATFYDAGVHLSLIGEMQSRFPPTNFAYNGVPLKNYHYLYDAILAGIVKITQVSYLDLYYRYAPVVLSLLLSLTIYLSVLTITKNRYAAALGIFFTVFGTSLGVLTKTGHNNVFMTDQIYDLIANPQGVLSLEVFLTLFLLLNLYENSKKKVYLIVYAILLSLSFGIKAHGGVVFALGTAGMILRFFLKKDYFGVFTLGLGLGGMFTWIIFSLDGSAVGIKFAPFWFLEKMAGDLERLQRPDLLTATSKFRTVFLYVWLFMVYLFGSLGLRVLGLKALFINKRPKIFLIICGLSSLFIPIFFNQGKKPYDVVQFIPYFTLLSGIYFTVFLFGFINRFKSVALKVGIIVFLVIIFLTLDVKEFQARKVMWGQNVNDKTAISKPILEATTFMREKTNSDAIVYLPLSSRNLDTLWFTSLSWRRTVFSGEFFPFQVGVDIKNAKEAALLSNFDYVFLLRSEIPEFEKTKVRGSFTEVFSNPEVVILAKEK